MSPLLSDIFLFCSYFHPLFSISLWHFLAFPSRVRSFVVVVLCISTVLVCTCLCDVVVLSLCSVFVLRLDSHVWPLAENLQMNVIISPRLRLSLLLL